MQFAALIGPRRAVMVQSFDANAGIADWSIDPASGLSIRFHGQAPDVTVTDIDPSVEVVANRYLGWTRQQTWSPAAASSPPRFIAVASSPRHVEQMSRVRALRAAFGSPIAVWLTQYRRHPFDVGYPDYTPTDARGFRTLLAMLAEADCIPLPYVNGLLLDWRRTSKGDREQLALRDLPGDPVPYSRRLPDLCYACPDNPAWRQRIGDAIAALQASSPHGAPVGVYVDMALAAAPVICHASDHGHAPGDPTAWTRGIRALLGSLHGLIMAEGCAEPYLDLIDLPLMHLHTPKTDAVPLWSMIHGDKRPAVGWSLAAVDTVAAFRTELERASRFGVACSGSPWMSHAPEVRFLEPAFARLRKSVLAGRSAR